MCRADVKAGIAKFSQNIPYVLNDLGYKAGR
jgi:hypothetical protein